MHIEKLFLLRDNLDGPLLAAFSKNEVIDLQFGLDWLSNMASSALLTDEEAVIYIARISPTDFVACPMKINSRGGYAWALSTFYTTTYSPIVASATPEKLFTALFKHLARVERFASLTLTPMDIDSPVYDLVRRALDRAGWRGIHDFFCFGNWIHDLDTTTYQSYLAARPSQLRNTVTRRTRQFFAADRGRLELVTGGDELERAIDCFVAIYNDSWKQSEPYPEFIPKLLRLSASRGWLRLGIASYDDKPVASQIWLVWAGTAQIFKLAYRKDYGKFSPGTILTAFLMEHAMNKDLVSRIDYLSGDDKYKQDWMSTRRERHGIAAYNPRTIRGTSTLLGRAVNSHVKKLYSRTPSLPKSLRNIISRR